MPRIFGFAGLILAVVATGAQATPEAPPLKGSLGSALALPLNSPAPEPQAFLFKRNRKPREVEPEPTKPNVVLSAERARVLLRSLTIPGWGQITTGHPKAAAVFAIVEASVWTSYTAFSIQNRLRRQAYFRTAKVQGGIDLKSRDEEFQRIVGSYLSSDEYNQLVVARDAANLYYSDPVAFQAYITEHSLKGADLWTWPDDEALLRYRSQRKDSQRAQLRANAALAMAVVNRLLSAIHAARLHDTTTSQTWELQTQPGGDDPTALRLGVLRRF